MAIKVKEENNIDYDSVVTPEKKMKYLEKLQKEHRFALEKFQKLW